MRVRPVNARFRPWYAACMAVTRKRRPLLNRIRITVLAAFFCVAWYVASWPLVYYGFQCLPRRVRQIAFPIVSVWAKPLHAYINGDWPGSDSCQTYYLWWEETLYGDRWAVEPADVP